MQTLSRAEDKERIDLGPEQIDIDYAKQRKMPQARGDLLLQYTKNRETLVRRVSEQESSAGAVEYGQFYIANLLWMETVLLLHAEKIQNQGILRGRDYKKFLTIMSRSDQ